MKFLALVISFLVLISCASVPTVETLTAEGGQVVEGGVGSLIGDDGVTLNGVDKTWSVFLSPDGVKKVFIKPNNSRQTLSWRRKDDGTYCEMMADSSGERCDSESFVIVKDSSGTHYAFTDGKVGKYPFTVTPGNPGNL